MPSLGDTLQNRYQITRVLGSGGFSTVYLANDRNLAGREVAVKVMSLVQVAATDRPWTVNQFRQEAMLLGRLNHPGIVKVSDFFDIGNDYYLVMEYVRAQTLETVLAGRSGQRLSEREALDLVTQLAAILEFLHEWKDPVSGQVSPIIFRDLKPANIMVTQDNQIKLIDFGTARFFKSGKTKDTQNLGTPGYASPEQYGQGQTDVRSDVYSLGVLLLELVTGYDPSQTPLRLPDVQMINPAVSPRTAAAIRKAINLDPALRFSNIPAFCNALGISGELVPTPPRKRSSLSMREFAIIAAVVLILACLTGTVLAAAGNLIPGWILGTGSTETPTLPSIVTVEVLITVPPDDPTPISEEEIVALTPIPPAEDDDDITITPSATLEESTITPTPVTPTLTPEPEPTSRGRIAFVSDQNGPDSIFVMDIDNPSAARQITSPSSSRGYDWWPAWCNENEIVFERADNADDPTWQEIVSINLNSGSERNVTSSSLPDEADMNGVPSCSPDGRYVAMSSRIENPSSGSLEWLAGRIDRANDSYATFYGDQYKAGHMSWSSDGNSIAMMHFPVPGDSDFHIYSVNLNNPSTFVNLTEDSGYNSKYPVWSPVSDEIIFACGTGSGDGRRWSLCSSRAGRQGATVLRSGVGFGSERENRDGGDKSGHMVTPSWSPDGRYVTFAANMNGNFDIYMYEIASDNLVNLTNTSDIDEMHPVWRPEG